MGTLEQLGIKDFKQLVPVEPIECCEKVPKDFRMVYKNLFDSKSIFTATILFSQLHNKLNIYSIRKYDASVRWVDNNPPERLQSFQLIDKRIFFSFKEAYNLLQGRYVLKRHVTRTGREYPAWTQLDFEYIDSKGNYCWVEYPKRGFNVRVALRTALWAEFGRRRLDLTRLDNLVKSLEQGNLEVIPVQYGTRTKFFSIEANPKDRRIKLTDCSIS